MIPRFIIYIPVDDDPPVQLGVLDEAVPVGEPGAALWATVRLFTLIYTVRNKMIIVRSVTPV